MSLFYARVLFKVAIAQLNRCDYALDKPVYLSDSLHALLCSDRIGKRRTVLGTYLDELFNQCCGGLRRVFLQEVTKTWQCHSRPIGSQPLKPKVL
ncbi:MAG: hypothetical protein ACI8W7_001525, partial [Gammaproteobacteria bacterium]